MNTSYLTPEILISSKQLDAIVSRVADEILADCRSDTELLLLCVLKGAAMFTSDLAKKLDAPVMLDYIKVSSYGSGTKSSGVVRLEYEPAIRDFAGKRVVVVEDIVDTGRTARFLCEYLTDCGAADIKFCTLLDKPSRREVEFVPDYVGMTIPNKFVVGYGLDYNEHYRGLPYVGLLNN
ncbi:MAG: hypoxanthine phosphoribosyltransferase [Oscillospiraceae bacterium]|nr:hypoxanthine phosphoribosyltransferase [Oscillospiraceae bacterium]